MPEMSDQETVEFLFLGRIVRFYLPGFKSDHIQKLIHAKRSFYELDLLTDAQLRLKPGQTVVDVGANIGNHTVFFSRICECNVIAFEPFDTVRSILRRNIELNGVKDRVDVRAIAVGEKEGIARIETTSTYNLGATMVHRNAPGENEVIIRSLDSELKGKDVNMIKVDVEGMELELIQGARETLNRCQPIIYIEAHTPNRFLELETLMESLGYTALDRFAATPTYVFVPLNGQKQRDVCFTHRLATLYHDTQTIAGQLKDTNVSIDSMAAQSSTLFRKHDTLIEERTNAILKKIEESAAKNTDQLVQEISELQASLRNKDAQNILDQLKDTNVSIDAIAAQSSENFRKHKVLIEERTNEILKKIEGSAAKDTDQLVQKISELQASLRDKDAQIRKLKKDNQRIGNLKAELAKKELSIKGHLSYQIGNIIVRYGPSPLKWYKIPFGIYSAVQSKKKEKKALETDGVKQFDIKIKLSDNVLYDANSLFMSGHQDDGIAYAKQHAGVGAEYLPHLLQANAKLKNDKDWLFHLNKYLEHYNCEPIQLKSSSKKRFFRLSTDIKPRSVKDGPKISVLMPVYNSEDTLEFAVRSVLDQTWDNLELIIVDDKSSDNTLSLAKQIARTDNRVIVISNKNNTGPYVAKNIALQYSTGKYITGHDGDDWAHPRRLENHMKHLETLPKRSQRLATLCSMLRLTDKGEFDRITVKTENTLDGGLCAAFISCFFDAAFLKEALGGWDSVRFGGDSELIARAEQVLGQRLERFMFLGMMCLSNPDGLTSDPTHGTEVNGRMSDTRRKYRNSYRAWHKKLAAGDVYLGFPLVDRPFAAPVDMIVDVDSAITSLETATIETGNASVDRAILEQPICILTDCVLPGGNCSSVIDTVRYFPPQDVSLVHCPSNMSQGRAISERYSEFFAKIKNIHDVDAVHCEKLIIFHPATVHSRRFSFMSKKIQAKEIYFVMNNSAFNAEGKRIYNPNVVQNHIQSIAGDKLVVCPAGPVIRREIEEHQFFKDMEMSAVDWNPTFDVKAIDFKPKPSLLKPYIIGRHSRDNLFKWPENKERLLSVYPESEDFRIRILGGADTVLSAFDYEPTNWEILPFGSSKAADYLATLDAFVYFPHAGLREAFGMTIVEAMLAGVPCILPKSFEKTFGNMAIYCDHDKVSDVISRLAEDDQKRIEFLSWVRQRVELRFGTSSIANRFVIDLNALDTPPNDTDRNSFINYKRWVEGN